MNVLHGFGAAFAQICFVLKHCLFVPEHVFFVPFIDVGIDVGIDVSGSIYPSPAQLHQSMEKTLARH